MDELDLEMFSLTTGKRRKATENGLVRIHTSAYRVRDQCTILVKIQNPLCSFHRKEGFMEGEMDERGRLMDILRKGLPQPTSHAIHVEIPGVVI